MDSVELNSMSRADRIEHFNFLVDTIDDVWEYFNEESEIIQHERFRKQGEQLIEELLEVSDQYVYLMHDCSAPNLFFAIDMMHAKAIVKKKNFGSGDIFGPGDIVAVKELRGGVMKTLRIFTDNQQKGEE